MKTGEWLEKRVEQAQNESYLDAHEDLIHMLIRAGEYTAAHLVRKASDQMKELLAKEMQRA